MKRLSNHEPLLGEILIDDLFSLWNTRREEVDYFTEHANSFHLTIKFTAEVSQSEVTLLQKTVYKKLKIC